ncbi:hypothetical protein H0902_23855, partial [Microcystis aeruginosa BLCCF108]|nr:hypothetical protein [Microcystis aeruginosa BLCC-F108]
VISYQLSVISYQLSVIRSQESGVSNQESGVRRLVLFILPTPHTPHPTPYTHEKLFQQTLNIGESS